MATTYASFVPKVTHIKHRLLSLGGFSDDYSASFFTHCVSASDGGVFTYSQNSIIMSSIRESAKNGQHTVRLLYMERSPYTVRLLYMDGFTHSPSPKWALHPHLCYSS
jgi:hypothetical protein